MKASIQDITRALAPGIALTSIIFYNTSLQNRFTYISSRIRDLNREARELRDTDKDADRLRSVRWQVDLFTRRSLLMRRAILVLYFGFFCFILTILALLALGDDGDRALPLVPFTLGFCALALATLMSQREMYLSHRTLLEDTRSSWSPPGGEPGSHP